MSHSVQDYLRRQTTENLRLLLWAYSATEEPHDTAIRDEIFLILEERRGIEADNNE